jgi:putative FmdB family regulatory protein
MLPQKFYDREAGMPVYQFICKKHGGFEKISIRAEWDDIRCPKCGAKSTVDKKCAFERKRSLKDI